MIIFLKAVDVVYKAKTRGGEDLWRINGIKVMAGGSA